MTSSRIWQIDAVRGLAVIGMVIYHLAFALFFFGGYPIPIFHWSLEIFQTIVAGTFLELVGVSLFLSWQKLQEKNALPPKILRVLLRRSLKIFSAALLVTMVTWIFLPDVYVRFGVLHLIAVSSVLAVPFLRTPKTAAFLGIFLLSIPLLFSPLPEGSNLTLWLGFKPPNFSTLDYFPVLPWFGLILIGVWAGSRLRFPNVPDKYPLLSRIGRHSLLIYLLHQPLVIAFVYLLRILN